MENFCEQVDRCRLKTNEDEINWFNDFYSDIFSLDFASLFSTIEWKSFSHFNLIRQFGLHVKQFRGKYACNFKSLAQLLPKNVLSPITITSDIN